MNKFTLTVLMILLLQSTTNAFTYNYFGTFTNTFAGMSGTLILDLDILPNDSIYGYVNFTDNTGGIIPLCAAGNFSGKKINDSLYFSFISHDTDSGCGFDWGAFILMQAKLINNCDSISGEYIYQNQQVGFYNLHKINSAPCNITGIKNYSNTVLISVYPNPVSSEITIDLNTSSKHSALSLSIFDSLGKEIYYTTNNLDKSLTLDMKKLSDGIYFLTVETMSELLTQKFIKY